MSFSIAYSLNKTSSVITFFKITEKVLNYPIVNISDIDIPAHSSVEFDFTNPSIINDIFNFLKGSENLSGLVSSDNINLFISAILLSDSVRKNNKNQFSAAKILEHLSVLTKNPFLQKVYSDYDPHDKLSTPSIAFHISENDNLELYLVFYSLPLRKPFIELSFESHKETELAVSGAVKFFTSASTGGNVHVKDIEKALHLYFVHDSDIDEEILNLGENDLQLYLNILLTYINNLYKISTNKVLINKVKSQETPTLLMADITTILQSQIQAVEQFHKSNNYMSVFSKF